LSVYTRNFTAFIRAVRSFRGFVTRLLYWGGASPRSAIYRLGDISSLNYLCSRYRHINNSVQTKGRARSSEARPPRAKRAAWLAAQRPSVVGGATPQRGWRRNAQRNAQRNAPLVPTRPTPTTRLHTKQC
jgi:hypothetical protein